MRCHAPALAMTSAYAHMTSACDVSPSLCDVIYMTSALASCDVSPSTVMSAYLTSHVDTALATPSSRGRGSSSGSRSFSASGSQSSSGSVSRPNECTFCHATDHHLLTCPIRVRQRGPGHYRFDCSNNPTRRRDTRPQSTAAITGVSSTAFTSPTLIDDPQMGQTLGIGRRHGHVDVPADPPDDTLHVVPPPIVYPMESSSTDPAPPVLPPIPLPSDIPVLRSTRVREVPVGPKDKPKRGVN
ncbi:hypothetical protein Acr_00g0076280 [Actinidia rufa]|uniref:Uncharacterized protein n=1 Tax=Actinidia rufa TaxID=165716 RepID=A0A7J0DTF8_9ERIC|nr:hypothetical protein Acr_00g0076280 [Actinidia rufa]